MKIINGKCFYECKECGVYVRRGQMKIHKKKCDPVDAAKTQRMMDGANKSVSKMFKDRG